MVKNKVGKAIADVQNGKMVIIIDDKNRENEGDLVISAEKITPEAINFMTHYGRGLICMPMCTDYFKRLDIPMMVQNNQSHFQTAFGVSIGAAKGITTGISAYDRALTIQVAANPKSNPDDIVKPGHIFPLKAVEGGVLKRRGQTEASVDLMQLAGLNSAAAICEIMNFDGTMSREHDLNLFSNTHQLTMISVQDIVEYRLQTEMMIEKTISADLPTDFGKMTIHYYKNKLDSFEWVAITSGDIKSQSGPLVRLHSQCLTGDVLGSKRCDCGEQLKKALQEIAKQGGVLLYLPQEGRGIGLENKIKSYALQDKGLDTVDANHQLGFQADEREYFIAAQILKDHGVNRIRLMTNNPNKISELKKQGIIILEQIPLIIMPNPENAFYLKTKQNKMGHTLNI